MVPLQRHLQARSLDWRLIFGLNDEREQHKQINLASCLHLGLDPIVAHTLCRHVIANASAIIPAKTAINIHSAGEL